MDTSDEKDMIMRKLAIYGFGCKKVWIKKIELLSNYCLYQRRLVETISYSEIVKPNIPSRK